jgi:multimeric flavodoxin WrbA
MRAVLFNGSPRAGGNTRWLLDYLGGKLAALGGEVDIVQVGGQTIRGCMACMKCKEHKDGHCAVKTDILNQCLDKMVAADVIVIGSPVYYSSMTAETKALIDRAGYVSGANDRLLSRKIGAGVAVARRAGRMTTFNAINQFFLISDMIVPGSRYWNVGIARDIGDMEKDEEGLLIMERLAQNIAWLHEKIST